ncbi:MAG: hypothetical protein MJZ51_05330 [Bacteroidales bacterium]|nr:hypothetical protein [Bacteroidales bacterium]
MENKKNYIKPELKSVEFKVELGFAASSLSQGMGNLREQFRDNPDGIRVNWKNGFLSGNDDDWD